MLLPIILYRCVLIVSSEFSFHFYQQSNPRADVANVDREKVEEGGKGVINGQRGSIKGVVECMGNF